MSCKSHLNIFRVPDVYFLAQGVIDSVCIKHCRLRVRQLADLPIELRAGTRLW